jgi:hypothetical protein
MFSHVGCSWEAGETAIGDVNKPHLLNKLRHVNIHPKEEGSNAFRMADVCCRTCTVADDEVDITPIIDDNNDSTPNDQTDAPPPSSTTSLTTAVTHPMKWLREFKSAVSDTDRVVLSHRGVLSVGVSFVVLIVFVSMCIVCCFCNFCKHTSHQQRGREEKRSVADKEKDFLLVVEEQNDATCNAPISLAEKPAEKHIGTRSKKDRAKKHRKKKKKKYRPLPDGSTLDEIEW